RAGAARTSQTLPSSPPYRLAAGWPKAIRGRAKAAVPSAFMMPGNDGSHAPKGPALLERPESGRRDPRVLCWATQGSGSNDESRIRTLLADLDPEVFAFDRAGKAGSVLRLLRDV